MNCGSSSGTWLSGELCVEFLNGSSCIGRILHMLPRALGLIVAHPIDQVLNFALMESRILDRCDLKLKKTIHLDGKRGGHDAVQERVHHMRFQEADMEHRIDVHG